MNDDQGNDVKYCSICGAELNDFERDCGQTICDNCRASIVINPDIDPDLGDFML